MTVQELIEKLSKIDPNKRVVVLHHESGYSDVAKIINLELAIDFHKVEPWSGPHEFKCFFTENHTGKFEEAISIGY